MSLHKLIIVSGPSGSGKTTGMRSVMKNEIVSFTTREKREGEVDGIDYIYISDEEFRRLLDTGGISESTTYYGRANYGITQEELDTKLGKGAAFVIVDANGKQQLEALYPNTLSIFFDISQMTALRRMVYRKDSPESVRSRLLTIPEELENFYLYDYVIDANKSKEEVVQSIQLILKTEGISCT